MVIEKADIRKGIRLFYLIFNLVIKKIPETYKDSEIRKNCNKLLQSNLCALCLQLGL